MKEAWVQLGTYLSILSQLQPVVQRGAGLFIEIPYFQFFPSCSPPSPLTQQLLVASFQFFPSCSASRKPWRTRSERCSRSSFQFFPSCSHTAFVSTELKDPITFQFFPSCSSAAGERASAAPRRNPAAAFQFFPSCSTFRIQFLSAGALVKDFQFFPSCSAGRHVGGDRVVRRLDDFQFFPSCSRRRGCTELRVVVVLSILSQLQPRLRQLASL